jgi:type II secretory ATPase GspE/PulE/Tfp pilus assembly ATPase PilB-like protein
MIGAIDHKKYKIITLEDPIEYHLAGIQQSQIDEYR